MTSRAKIMILTIITILILLPVITNRSVEVNIVKGNTKVAEVGGYKVKKVKDILEPNTLAIFHYYSKDCIACDKQHIELMSIKNMNPENVNIIGIGSGSYPKYEVGSENATYKNIYWDAYNEIAKKMQIIGTPTIFLVDHNGKVVKKYVGYIQAKDLLRKFELQGKV